MIIKIDNSSQFGWFSIKATKGNVSCFTKENEPFKINFNKPGGSQSEMKDYSLTELENIVFVVLSAYLFSHQTLEKMMSDNLSDKELSNQRNLILLIRNSLKEITEFINSYDEVVINKYKNI